MPMSPTAARTSADSLGRVLARLRRNVAQSQQLEDSMERQFAAWQSRWAERKHQIASRLSLIDAELERLMPAPARPQLAVVHGSTRMKRKAATTGTVGAAGSLHPSPGESGGLGGDCSARGLRVVELRPRVQPEEHPAASSWPDRGTSAYVPTTTSRRASDQR